MPNLIRTFIAVPLTSQIHQNLADFIQLHKLDSRDAGLRAIKPVNIHLTLKFLGDVEASRIPVISDRLHEVTNKLAPLPISIHGLGVFPGWRKRPRVIWVGADPAVTIIEMFQQVDSATATAGFPTEERGFSPHLTLARIDHQPANPAQRMLLDQLMNIKPEPVFGQMTINEVVLFKSLLQPSGPVYTVLSRHPFSD